MKNGEMAINSLGHAFIGRQLEVKDFAQHNYGKAQPRKLRKQRKAHESWIPAISSRSVLPSVRIG